MICHKPPGQVLGLLVKLLAELSCVSSPLKFLLDEVSACRPSRRSGSISEGIDGLFRLLGGIGL